MAEAYSDSWRKHSGILRIVSVAGALLAASGAGMAIPFAPAIAILPLAALALVLIVTKAQFRLAFLILGGLTVLHSSGGLSLVKIAYLVGTGVALSAAVRNLVRRSWNHSDTVSFRPLLWCSLLFFLLVAISFPVAMVSGNSVSAWLRDVAPYLLFASVPIFALDCRANIRESILISTLLVAGLLSSASFAVQILQRRNYLEIPFHEVVLPSFLLSAALFCFAFSRVLNRKRARLFWFAVSVVVVFLLLGTGTRSILVLLLAPPFVVIVTRGKTVGRILPLVFLGGVIITLALVLAPSLSRYTSGGSERLLGRWQSIPAVLANPQADWSVVERGVQTRVAWATFAASPVLGSGPGHVFNWNTPYGTQKHTFNIDTPVSYLAKFGVAGLMVLAAMVVAFIVSLRRVTLYAGRSLGSALAGYGTVVAGAAAFESPFEDKGLSFGLIFLLALMVQGQARSLDTRRVSKGMLNEDRATDWESVSTADTEAELVPN
jgi:hypothetical protein